jgi:hypothetical protein
VGIKKQKGEQVNLPFKSAIVGRAGSQCAFAKMARLHPGCLSNLVRGRRGPSESERKKLGKFFTEFELRMFFPAGINQYTRGKAQRVEEQKTVVNE